MSIARIKSLIVLTSTLLFAVLGTPARAEDKPAEIRIAYPGAGTGGRPLGTGSFFATAHLKGALEQEFKADGIKVKWNFYPGAGPAVNEAYANGLVDFAGHGDLPLIVGRSTGLKHKIILSYGRFGNTYFVVPAGSQAKSLADLKGKRIATFKGTAGQLSLARVLEKYGYTEKDFKVISMDTDTTKAALATGDIDGALISPFDLEARGVARRLFEIKRDPKITSVSTFWVSEEFEKKYPQIVQRVVNTLLKSAVWNADEKNRDQIFKLWAQSGSTPYADYVKSWEGYTLKERNSPLLDEYYVVSLKKAIDESRRYKLIRRDVDINGWIEPKYLNAGLKELKLEGFWPEYDANGNPKS
ncbi:putative aliphatic sulfonates-binding protein [Andreprevotia sp. IGB-42]|uniref:ABC transporter substrate-binding protein n=1 Tax=Andreprevotia sp. IGB-42 TaxID=2497473 RepID=UPI00135B88F4|nr:ABC transporter substrate-binding protein [Andreprevotia sp. IGB-42]KAF0815130.1 putative aliphatic sulfonates-binding protein [Andreprevotia sp. IGB-42]